MVSMAPTAIMLSIVKASRAIWTPMLAMSKAEKEGKEYTAKDSELSPSPSP